MEAEAEDWLVVLQVAVCAVAAVAHRQDHDKRRRHVVEREASDSIAVALTGWEEFELAEWRGEGTDATVGTGCE